MANAFPSGEQFEIHARDHRVVVVEVGAGLRSYTVAGDDVLDGYAADEMARSGRGQVLAPWPNRIEDGAYEFAGGRQQLPLNEPKARNAIHGLVRWSSWSVAERSADRILMEHTLHPQPGYPFSLALGIENVSFSCRCWGPASGRNGVCRRRISVAPTDPPDLVAGPSTGALYRP